MTRLQPADQVLRRERWIVGGVLAVVILACTVFILAGAGTGMSTLGMAAHTGPLGALIGGTPDMLDAATWTPSYAMIIFLMWWLMMVAMMLPSAGPAILLYGALYRDRGSWGMLEFAAGYLVAWAIFSVVATLVQGGLSANGLISPMYMNVSSLAVAGVILICSGAYQFTPLKSACLTNCRGPAEALVRHRRTGRSSAFRMGLAHGVYCLGCCFALMALLFAGGIMNLWWILAIALYVALEKLAPFGSRLAKPVGALLVAGGLALVTISLRGS